MNDQEAKQALSEARSLVRREGLALARARKVAELALLEEELAKRAFDHSVSVFVAASEEVAP
ncbi:hypothetical protein LCGC14_1103800 [marine sediment metagenome]|uniref:Uncharacterized protein n=1 Tax=marine sediment metagenome TaxID=412755 RepID=A0A0F9MWL5_9ZZZZ